MYAKRLEIHYLDINEALTTIEVWQDGFEGVVVQRDVQGNPLTIAWGDNAGQNLPTIYASTATIRFYQEAEGEFSDLFDSDKFKNLVKIYKDGNEIWRGYVKGDTWEEERSAAGVAVAVEFTAIDMLIALKYIPLANPAEWIAEYQTIEDVLTYILEKVTGLELPVLHSINWETDKGYHYLSALVNVDYLEGKMCYDILESLLFGCRVFQREAMWYIIDYSVIGDDEIVVTIPASLVDDFRTGDYRAGDFRARIPGTDTHYRYLLRADHWFESRLSLELLQGYRNYVINEDQGLIENNVKNGDFADGINNWDYENIIMGIYHIKQRTGDETNYYAWLPGSDYPAIVTDQNWYMWQQIPHYMNSLDRLRITFKYGVVGQSNISVPVYCVIKMIGTSANRYATYAINSTGRIYLIWTSNPTFLRLGAKDDGGAIAYDDIECNPNWNDWTAKLKLFDMITDDIELAGTLELQFYVPYTPDPSISGSIWTKIKVQVLDENADEFENDNEIIVANNSAYLEDFEKDLIIVEGPQINNVRNAYSGAILLDNYAQPSGWRRIGGSTYFPLNEHRALIYKQLTRQTRSNYHALVADARADMRIIISDTEAVPTTKRLLENGVSYHDRMNQLEGQFVEIKV